MSRITVLYFAAVRDLVGLAEESLELPQLGTVAALKQELERVHPALSGRLEGVRFAINEEFAHLDDAIRPRDVIAILPPVAGG